MLRPATRTSHGRMPQMSQMNGKIRPQHGQSVVTRAASTGGTILREVLDRAQRSKLNTGDDRAFYDTPRMVYHVDDAFVSQLTQLYRERIPSQGAVVLDLMSSWVSHLPPEASYARVVGHGLNAAELARNKQLSEFFVRNLNTDPDGWAFADQTFDAVICCVSVQYLQQPERVFAEIYRVLKPTGVCIVAFSNRLFYDKAIAAWRDNTGFGRAQLVSQYFGAVAGFTQPEIVTQVGDEPGRGGLLQTVQKFFKRAQGDPFYAVVAYRNVKPVYEANIGRV